MKGYQYGFEEFEFQSSKKANSYSKLTGTSLLADFDTLSRGAAYGYGGIGGKGGIERMSAAGNKFCRGEAGFVLLDGTDEDGLDGIVKAVEEGRCATGTSESTTSDREG